MYLIPFDIATNLMKIIRDYIIVKKENAGLDEWNKTLK